jgi:hypothetical protein
MSWIERELRRRLAKSQPATVSPPPAASESSRMGELWRLMNEANAALPSELQLRTVEASSVPASAEEIGFREWLRAPNGAALGYSGNGIRYVWPDTGQRRSNNFWIRWDSQRRLYILAQRTSASIPPSVAEYLFDETRAEHMVRYLVLGKRIKARSVRKRRLWLL